MMDAGMDLAANQSGTPDFYALNRLRARVAELEVEVNLLHRQRHAAQEDAANARLLAEARQLSQGEIDRLRARVAELEAAQAPDVVTVPREEWVALNEFADHIVPVRDNLSGISWIGRLSDVFDAYDKWYAIRSNQGDALRSGEARKGDVT